MRVRSQMKRRRPCSRTIVLRYKGKMTKRSVEKKERVEYIFPKHLKSVGGEQQSDKKGRGQTENTHQNSSKFNERTGERKVKREQGGCRRRRSTERSYYMHEQKEKLWFF